MCNLPISKRNLPPPPRPFIRTNCFCYCIFIFVLAELIWNFVLTGFTLLGSPEISMVSTTKDVQKLNADKKNTTASLFSHWPGTLDPEMDRIKEGPKNLSVSQALGVRGVITIPIKTSHHFYKYVDKISLAYFSPKMSTSPTPPPSPRSEHFLHPKKRHWRPQKFSSMFQFSVLITVFTKAFCAQHCCFAIALLEGSASLSSELQASGKRPFQVDRLHAECRDRLCTRQDRERKPFFFLSFSWRRLKLFADVFFQFSHFHLWLICFKMVVEVSPPFFFPIYTKKPNSSLAGGIPGGG